MCSVLMLASQFCSIVSRSYICFLVFIFFFFNDTATTEIYTLSLHDALPIYELLDAARVDGASEFYLYWRIVLPLSRDKIDRKSTRLNSSHRCISYAVFCLKKKKKKKKKYR